MTLFYNNGISLSKKGSQLACNLSGSGRKIYHHNLVTGKTPGEEGMERVNSPFSHRTASGWDPLMSRVSEEIK
jgi:hypothetical protein